MKKKRAAMAAPRARQGRAVGAPKGIVGAPKTTEAAQALMKTSTCHASIN